MWRQVRVVCTAQYSDFDLAAHLSLSSIKTVATDSEDPATRRRARLACDYQKAITNFNVPDDLEPLSPSLNACGIRSEACALVVDAYPDVCPDNGGTLSEQTLEP